jgi:hypothetical protein
MKFFEAVKNLFPRGRAFAMFAVNDKRRLIEGLSALPDDVRREAEKAYLDLFPETTRFPEEWEKTFAVYLTGAEQEKRRGIIDALWKTVSGDQGASFLQEVLRKIDTGLGVFENVPVSDPRNKQSAGLAICDYSTMVCDNETACCDYFRGDDTFTPGVIQNDKTDVYAIPDDTRFWETCFFIAKNIYRNNEQEILYIEPLEISATWKNIVEYLVLKIKPVHSTAVVFVKWIEGGASL